MIAQEEKSERLFRLDGRVAVVTGATGGIGAAAARLFARQGAEVVLAHLGPEAEAAERLESELSGDSRCLAVEADVRDAEQVEGLMARVTSEFGGLDIVLANAGIARRQALERLPDAEWGAVVDTNLGGVFRCFRAAIPRLRAGGRLLATTSICGSTEGWAEHAHYTASKAGIVGLVRSVALEVAERGITVNAVAPGLIRTQQSLDPVNSLGPAGVEAAAASIPAGRVGRSEDVAATFAFLASEEAAFVTGQTIVVDGGTTLGGY